LAQQWRGVALVKIPKSVTSRLMSPHCRKGLLAAVILTGSWLAFVANDIWQYGKIDRAQPADCIIVLGTAIEGDRPSPVFEQRIRHGIHLYQQNLAKRIIFTGGFGDQKAYSESQVASNYAQQQGIPKQAILIEEASRTTQQNLVQAYALMEKNNLRSAIIVSDPLHMKRAVMMARDLKIAAVSSPTPTSMYRTWKTQSGFLLRELYFSHHYLVTGN
jgi:uncharacterized SAM-binding protein YcdF (DUF218 family)